MPNAEDVIQAAEATLKKTEDAIRNHRYLAALEKAAINVDSLKAFPGNQYQMWKTDMRASANFVARFGDRRYGDFFIMDFQAELNARDQIVKLANKLGMSEDDLENFNPSSKGFAFATYFAWLSHYGTAGEIACGLALNLAAWGENCGRMSAALRSHYGFDHRDTAFLDGFASLPSFRKQAMDIVEDDLAHRTNPAHIIRAVCLFQSYELMFWDAMADYAAERPG